MSYIYVEHLLLMFLDHTQRRTTVGRTPGRVVSSSQRLLPDNTRHNRQISMPPVGFEPTTSADQRPAEIVGSNPTGGMDISLL